jgi:hypothetical protein
MSQSAKVLYMAKTHTTGGRANGASRRPDGRLSMLAKLATLLKIPVITSASEPNGPNGPLMPRFINSRHTLFT